MSKLPVQYSGSRQLDISFDLLYYFSRRFEPLSVFPVDFVAAEPILCEVCNTKPVGVTVLLPHLLRIGTRRVNTCMT
jgi:hypothetical protein